MILLNIRYEFGVVSCKRTGILQTHLPGMTIFLRGPLPVCSIKNFVKFVEIDCKDKPFTVKHNDLEL
jgi:hypothetical protein